MIDGWHKVNVMVEPPLGKPGVTMESVLQSVAAILAESSSPLGQFRPFNVQVEKQRELTFIIQRQAVARAIKDGLNTRLVGLSTGLEVKFTVKTKGSTPPRVETN